MSLLAISGHEAAQQVVNALSLGSVYALLALGVAAVFSVLGLINFAHGELVVLSGMMMLLLGSHGVPWAIVVPVTILTGGVAAIAMERIAFRPVRGAPAITPLLTSLGLSIIVRTRSSSPASARSRGTSTSPTGAARGSTSAA